MATQDAGAPRATQGAGDLVAQPQDLQQPCRMG